MFEPIRTMIYHHYPAHSNGFINPHHFICLIRPEKLMFTIIWSAHSLGSGHVIESVINHQLTVSWSSNQQLMLVINR